MSVLPSAAVDVQPLQPNVAVVISAVATCADPVDVPGGGGALIE